MKILVWNAPWAVQGDILFFRNCYLKHLLLQANLLAESNVDVDLVVNDFINDGQSHINDKISVINISATDIFTLTRGVAMPMVSLYKKDNQNFITRLKDYLAPKLAEHYDAILLWENPVPFLEDLYPAAVIIHQMPGALSRAPYPSTTTFDVHGLYKDGSIYKFSDQIISSREPTSALVDELKTNIKNIYTSLPSLLDDVVKEDQFEQLALLPLQVSNHYAFQADTPYHTQTDYLLDVLSRTPATTGIITTQYVSPNISDTVLTPGSHNSLKNSWPNLIFDSKFNNINNISQHLLPHVNKVITCSSSLGVQAMLWSKDVEVLGDTFLQPYDTARLNDLGLNPDDAHNKLLSFLLDRQQVLSTRIVHDKNFLVQLIEDVVARKRANKKGLESFPLFADLDSGYNNEVIEAINTKQLSNSFKAAGTAFAAEMDTSAKFERSIKRNNIESISFDVFDTLISRPVEVPSDAYQFLEIEALKISEGKMEDFARVRLVAEVETRSASEEGEITLDQIYGYIQNHYQAPDELIQIIKNREIALEIGLVEQRALGRKLWNIAVASKRPITIISDMYLPHDVVAKMLEKTGYTGFKKLYVSSDYGVRKKEGPLFDIVIEDQMLDPSKHLHIGDNKAADVDMAQARGMFAFRIPRAIDRMRSNSQYKKAFHPRSGVGQRSRSVIAGLIAHRFFDFPSGSLEQESLFMGSKFRLGYAALGPMLTAYMLWLSKKAQSDGVSKLYFLSREGWILKEIYDQINKNRPDAVPSAYLYCSRRAVRVAAIERKSDIAGVASQPFEPGVTIGRLLNQRFGLVINDEIEEIITKYSFISSDEKLTSDGPSRIRFSGLCMELSAFILAQSSKEREAYLAYLSETNLANEKSPAVVDIGWKANMQGSLGALIKRPLKGYYYATLQGAERWQLEGHSTYGFAGDSVSIDHSSAAINNRHLCEFLTCKADGSLISFSFSKNKELKPNFRHDPGQATRNLLIEEVHRGAIEFANHLELRFSSYLDTLVIDPVLCERIFKLFVEEPTAADAILLENYAFEDSFGGVDKKYIVSKLHASNSVWQKGVRAVTTIEPAQSHTSKPPAAASKPVPIVRQPQLGEMRASKLTGISGRTIKAAETLYIKASVNKKKFEKYKRNRDAFFQDSKDAMAIRWYSFTNPEI